MQNFIYPRKLPKWLAAFLCGVPVSTLSQRRYHHVAIAWWLITALLFLLPGSSLPKESVLPLPMPDKWVHAALFAIWSWLVYQAWYNQGKQPYPAAQVMLLGMAYGLGVEVIQHYLIAGRSFDSWDLVADGAGIGLGLLPIHVKSKSHKSKG